MFIEFVNNFSNGMVIRIILVYICAKKKIERAKLIRNKNPKLIAHWHCIGNASNNLSIEKLADL